MVNKLTVKTISNNGIKELREIINSYKNDNEDLFKLCNEEQRKQLKDKCSELFDSCLNYYVDKIQTEYDAEIEKLNEKKIEMDSDKNNAIKHFLDRVSTLKN